MLNNTDAIVLSKLKYRDYDLIVSCYTKKFGLVSYLLRGILKSRKGTVKNAYFQPLSQLQLTVVHKNNRSLQSITDIRQKHFYRTLHVEVLKSAIVMFLSEILTSTLKEEEANETLYSYLENTFLWLDTHSENANFHLLFLIKLTKHLGFYPDVSNIQAPYFNLEQGTFQQKKTNNYCITGENLNLLKLLLGTTFDALNRIKISSKQRQSFLNMILLYFELHLGSFKKPKSQQVFNQVFN